MTEDSTAPWDAASVLVWVAPGATPSPERLEAAQVQDPPRPNPTPFWRYSDAVEHTTETLANARHAGKEPWIKVNLTVFGPMEIAAHYRAILALRGR